MKKRIIASITAALLLLGSAAAFGQPTNLNNSVLAANSQIKLYLNNEIINSDVAPVNESGRVLVPIRIISEKLGANVDYEPTAQTVSISKDALHIVLKINNQEVMINNNTGTIDVAPKIINSRTMVPIRFVAQNLGCIVNWDGTTQSVNIVSQTESQKQEQTINVRYSQQSELERVVFDVPSNTNYQVAYDRANKKVTIQFTNSLLAPKTGNTINLNYPLISSLSLNQSSGQATATIQLKYAIPQVKDFVLDNPDRIVLDFAKVFEEQTVTDVAAGLQHIRIYRGTVNGPQTINILKMKQNSGLEIRPALAKDQIIGLEKVSAISNRHQALAAVNASYFISNGQPLGLLIFANQLLIEPYREANNALWSALALTRDGKMIIDKVDFHGGILNINGLEYKANGINRQRNADEIIIYTPQFNKTTLTNEYGWEWIVQNGVITGTNTANSPIPADGFVISAHGKACEQLQGVKVGDPVTLTWQLSPDWLNNKNIVFALSAGPQLIKNGAINSVDEWKLYKPDIVNGRAPRTAIGINGNNEIIIITVDGRQPSLSIGMSLNELAQEMLRNGAIEAINLDGGGSTTMVINNNIVNSPSDGHERSVANALIITSKRN